MRVMHLLLTFKDHDVVINIFVSVLRLSYIASYRLGYIEPILLYMLCLCHLKRI